MILQSIAASGGVLAEMTLKNKIKQTKKKVFGEIFTCHQFREHQKKEGMLARRLGQQCPSNVDEGPERWCREWNGKNRLMNFRRKMAGEEWMDTQLGNLRGERRSNQRCCEDTSVMTLTQAEV